MYWKKRAHGGPWKKMDTWRSMKKKAAMPQNIRRERPNHGLTYSFAFHSIHHIHTHTCTSRSWLYDLLTLWVQYLILQNIWNKYALVFLPTLSSTKAFLEVGERRCTKGLGEDINTLSEWECYSRNLFLFRKLLGTSRCNLEQGMGKWCFMNHSISQPPKTRRKPKAPWRLR